MSDPATAARIVGALETVAGSLMQTAQVGVDAVHIPTWRRHLDLGGTKLVDRIYQPAEIAFCADRPERLSSRLAGKEAVLKTLGTGIRGIALRDIEIVSESTGRPTVVLHGPAATRATELGVGTMGISLCHEEDFALAVAASMEDGRR
jgi:holo-[acyl-carrier protein] synthase